MTSYLRLFLRDGRKVILRNMQRREITIPLHDLKVECYVGVEVNKHGDEVKGRYGGRQSDEVIHLIQASEVVRCQPLGISMKYGWLVPADKVTEGITA